MLKALAAVTFVSLTVAFGHGSSAPRVDSQDQPAEAAAAAPRAAFKVRPRKPRAGTALRLIGRAPGCDGCHFRWAVVSKRHRLKQPLGGGRVLRHTFRRRGVRVIRLTVIDRRGEKTRRFKSVRVRRAQGSAPEPNRPPAPPAPGPIPSIAAPACAAGATPVTSTGALVSTLRSGRAACVTAAIGNLNLGSASGHIGTQGAGSIGSIEVNGASGLTLRARFRSIIIRRSTNVTIEQSIIGGSESSRVDDQLIFMPDGSKNVTIRDSDIGWTTADDSGNTGYGLRAYEDMDDLHVERNRFHHIAADGIQLSGGGANVLIDRNEFAYIAPPQSSDEHADDIQIVFAGPNLRMTNNYLHHNGYFTANGPRSGGSGPYIHAGGALPMLFENNLVRDELNFMQVGALGTGGCERSNLTFRRNSFFNNGTLFGGSEQMDLFWRLCGGSGNLFERNVVNNKLGNESGFNATARDNLVGGAYTLDADGDCTVPACNPPGQEPIGFRKPAGVHW